MSEMITVLRIKVDASGVVTGMAEVDKQNKNVGKSAESLIQKLVSQNSHLTGLQTAYSKGSAAVAAFNVNAAIQNNILKAGAGATADQKAQIAQLTVANHALVASTNASAAAMRGSQKSAGGFGVSIFNLRNLLAGVGIRSFVNEMISAQQTMDRMTNTLRVSGGYKGAAENMEFLRETAQRLGLDLASAGVAFAKFEVASQGSVLRGQGVKDIFLAVSEATTAMGLSSEVTEGAMLALQQMMSKGTVQSEELRGQFGERIPGAFRMAAEAMGMTELELAKALETGRVLSADLLPKLAAKLHETFGPQAAAGAKLLSAEINRLKTTFFDLFAGLSTQSGFVGLVKSTNDLITSFRNLAAGTGASGAIRDVGISASNAIGAVIGLVNALDKLKQIYEKLTGSGPAGGIGNALNFLPRFIGQSVGFLGEKIDAANKFIDRWTGAAEKAKAAADKLQFDKDFVGPKPLSTEEKNIEAEKAIALAYNNTKKALDNMLDGVERGRPAMLEAERVAKEYASSLEEMRNRFDPLRRAQEEEAAATALATDALAKNLITQENWQTIVDEAAEKVREKLNPGIHEYEANLKKLDVEIQSSIDDNLRLADAYAVGAEAVEYETKASFERARVQELMTEALSKGLPVNWDYIEMLRQMAGEEYEAAKAKEISQRLFEETSGIDDAVEMNRLYVLSIQAGGEALKKFNAFQQAYNTIVKPGQEVTMEMWKAIDTLAIKIADLNESMAGVEAAKWMDEIKFETEWLNKQSVALGQGEAALLAYARAKEIAIMMRNGLVVADDIVGPLMPGQLRASEADSALLDRDVAKLKTEMAEISKNFVDSLRDGMIDAVVDFAVEFAKTGDFSVQAFGEAFTDMMLSAAADWLKQMLVNQMTLAQTKQATDATSSMGAASATGGWVALFMMAAAAYSAYDQGKKDKKYNDGDFSRYYTGGMSGGKVRSDYTFYNADFEKGNTHDQNLMVTTVRGYLEAFREATGNVVTDIGEFTLQIRHDGEEFQTTYKGVILGQFKTIEDATLAGIRAAFEAGDFKGELSGIFKQMLTNFTGDAKDLLAGFKFVSDLEKDLSGLSEIEQEISDLPQQTDALKAKLIELGVSAGDAAALAGKWNAMQLSNIRDQITGHQATVAEQMAQKQREADMFNAQLELDKAKVAAEMTMLETQRAIEQAKVDLAVAGAQAQLDVINATLAAYGQVMAALSAIAPISYGEINIGGRGGRGGRGAGRSGPSEREQRETAFREFMDQQLADSMGEVERQLHDVNEAFDEHRRAAQELGETEELEAARLAAINRIRQGFLDGLRADSLPSDYQRALAELNEAFDQQALLNGDLVGGEEELARARHDAMMRLREELLDGFGSPMESVRDNLQAMIQRFADLGDANRQLTADFAAGRISAEEYAAAMEHSNDVIGEFNDQMAMNLLNMAVYFTDALGDTKASADIRAKLAEFEYNLKLAEFELTIQTAYAQHWINQELYDYLLDILDKAKKNPPDFDKLVAGAGGSGGSSEDPRNELLQQLLRALDRLRAVVQTYTDFLLDLQTSELSPYSIETQYGMAEAEYQRLLALAQAGDINAMEALPAAAQSYLELASQMFGTASAGYNEIFQGINLDMTEIMGSLQDILDAVPSQYRPIEERLDTTNEILANMYLLQLQLGGGGGGGGNGTMSTTNLRDAIDYFGDMSDADSGALNDLINRINADGEISNLEMESFVRQLERYTGATLTNGQIAALRRLLEALPWVGSTPPATGGGGDPDTGTGGGGNVQTLAAAGGASQSAGYLKLIADLTAKGIREAKSDRMKRPSLSHAGYAGTKVRRGS